MQSANLACEVHLAEQEFEPPSLEQAGRRDRRIESKPQAAGMATERQIAANRANARRSTGPKSNRGRCVSSRNALQHGLSSSTPPQQSLPLDIDDLAKALSRPEADESEAVMARQVARAHVELLRARAVRARLLAVFDPHRCIADDLRQLLALDRYERIARGKRRCAVKRLFTE
jgi:hypothetical protein